MTWILLFCRRWEPGGSELNSIIQNGMPLGGMSPRNGCFFTHEQSWENYTYFIKQAIP